MNCFLNGGHHQCGINPAGSSPLAPPGTAPAPRRAKQRSEEGPGLKGVTDNRAPRKLLKHEGVGKNVWDVPQFSMSFMSIHHLMNRERKVVECIRILTELFIVLLSVCAKKVREREREKTPNGDVFRNRNVGISNHYFGPIFYNPLFEMVYSKWISINIPMPRCIQSLLWEKMVTRVVSTLWIER